MSEHRISVAIKRLLLKELEDQGISNAELARLMGTSPQEVSRITNIEHYTKVDTLDRAFRALGKKLIFTLR